MPVGVNELMWAAHDRRWIMMSLILEGLILTGKKSCHTKAVQMLLVRSPDKETCDAMLSPHGMGLRPQDDCFKQPHTTILHLMANQKPADDDDEMWNAYARCWQLAAAVLHNNKAVDARAGLPGSGGKTPLMVAAVQNNQDAMDALLRAGASGLRRVRD
jgi:ankyrin repeat protein